MISTTATFPGDEELITKILNKKTQKKCSAQGNIELMAELIVDAAKRQFRNTDKKTSRKYTNRMYEADIDYIVYLIREGKTVKIPILNEKNSNYLAKSLGLNEEETKEYFDYEEPAKKGWRMNAMKNWDDDYDDDDDEFAFRDRFSMYILLYILFQKEYFLNGVMFEMGNGMFHILSIVENQPLRKICLMKD